MYRRLIKHAAAAALALLCCGVAAAGDLMLSAAAGELWKASRKELGSGVLAGAKGSRVDDKTIRLVGNRNLTVAGFAPNDISLTWDDAKEHLVKVETTTYNKGDNSPLDKSEFEQGVKMAIDTVTTIMESKPTVPKIGQKDAGVKPRAWVWESGACAVLLEAYSTGAGKRYSAEFIRLTIAPDKEGLKRGGANDAARRTELKSNVCKDKDGTVWIKGIPMVDQGEKGYCVPAAISRVFAYYNMDGVDQHALAALCKSTGEEGTTIEGMSKALSSICSKFHMSPVSWRWVNEKNVEKEYIKRAQKAGMLSSRLDPKLLLEAVKAKPAMIKKGFKDIRRYIDDGIPVVWGVVLGIYPEQGIPIPQAAGGHMRLIIGYNEQLQVILYSDSWGAGHEVKQMPLAQACAISKVLYVLRPMR